MNSHCFKLHRSYLISFNLSNTGELFRVISERTVCKFRKRKTKFCVVLTNSIKRAREIRKFHVAVVQQQITNVQKSVMRVQKMCFCQSRPFVFLLFAVAVAKTPNCCHPEFCYHDNVKSHVSSLLHL